MIIRFATIILACAMLAGCNTSSTTKQESASTDTVRQEAPAVDSIITREVIFKDINAVEGTVSLVFTDANGAEVWIAKMEDGVDQSLFCTREENPGTPFPIYKVQAAAQGKSFKITYRIELSDDNPAAEMVQVPVLMSAQPVNN